MVFTLADRVPRTFAVLGVAIDRAARHAAAGGAGAARERSHRLSDLFGELVAAACSRRTVGFRLEECPGQAPQRRSRTAVLPATPECPTVDRMLVTDDGVEILTVTADGRTAVGTLDQLAAV